MASSIAIKIQGLIKEFRPNKRVIQGIDLSVNRGELFCLVGDNGAGKTTLIKILCNLILPTSGEIFINGYNLLCDSEKARASIGLVTGDERSFYWRLTGRQNLEFFATLYNLFPIERKAKIRNLFNLLDIKEPDKIFQEYSSGVKQRLSIARALLNDPSILFIDELTKSLDPISAKNLRRFIKDVLVAEQGKTVVFSTLQLYEAVELAHRIAFISQGSIKAIGTFVEFKKMFGRDDSTIEEIYNYFCQQETR